MNSVHALSVLGLDIDAYAPDGFRAPACRGDVLPLLELILADIDLPALPGSGAPSDVEPDAPGYATLLRLYQAGILTGDADGAFHSDAPLTRAQLAAVLARAARANDLLQEEALSKLEAHLVELGYFGPGLTGPEDPGEAFCFSGVSSRSIQGVRVYSAQVRWAGGPMDGRLLMTLAVSTDGARYFEYDPAEDVWTEI